MLKLRMVLTIVSVHTLRLSLLKARYKLDATKYMTKRKAKWLNCDQIKFTHWLPDLFAKNAIFWIFSAWIWAKLAPIYSKRHLQHHSRPFFLLATFLLLLRHVQKSNFQVLVFFTFPFPSFVVFLQQWLIF